MERLKIVGRWLWTMLWPFLALVTGFLATLETIALLYFPNPSIFWQRQVFWSGTWIAFVLSAFWAWIKQYRTNQDLKATILQQAVSLAQAAEKETTLTVANAELTAITEALQGEIDVLNDQLTPTLSLSAPFIELSRYRDESIRNGSKYFHIVRVSVHNSGSVGISRIRVIAKNFIWHHEDYSGKPFYPKDDFNTHSDGSFYLEAGGSRQVDIALREPSPAVGHGSPMTHFRLALPPYMSNVIGDNEILGLTIQVVAPGYPQTPEQRLDLYLEKQQLTKSTGEISFQKILRVRPSEQLATSPTEVRMWQDPAVEEPGPARTVP